MSDLEEKLRAIVAKGELTYLSVASVAGKGPGGVEFAATYAPASKWGQGFGRDPDIVKAIEKALVDHRMPDLVKKLSSVSPEAAAIADSVPDDPLHKPKKRSAALPPPVKAGAVDDSDFA
jgi:hypothetical protein